MMVPAVRRAVGLTTLAVRIGNVSDRRRTVEERMLVDCRKGASNVIFGRPGDASLVGALTLEALGLMLDPLRRELRPLPMMLA